MGNLELLNLGQNDLSGEIPLIIGEERNDGRVPLTSVRDFFRLLSTHDPTLQDLRRHFISFLRKYIVQIEHSRDMLWIDSERSDWGTRNLQEIINEYIKAQENHFLSKTFQNILMDPVRLVDAFNSRPTQRLGGTVYSPKRRRIA
jgi:hypothetical protein